MDKKPKKAMTNSERIHILGAIFSREKVMDCILESLVDEMVNPKEHLNQTDML